MGFIYKRGGSQPPVTEPLAVTPGTTETVVTAEDPVTGFTPVTVEAVTAAIDANIQPDNIKEGVEILGVTGTLEGVGYYRKAFLMSLMCSAELNNSRMPAEVTEIDDDLGIVTRIGTYRIGPGVRFLRLPLCTSIGTYPLGNANNVEEVILPKLQVAVPISGLIHLKKIIYAATSISNSNYFNNTPALEYFACGTLTSFTTFRNAVKLRHVEVGQDTNINLPINQWTATDVISEGQTGIDELNYNITTYLAGRLKDLTGDTAKTVTLGTSLYNVLTPETIAAFTAKNWNLAYA